MSGFTNPLVGAGGDLVYPQIQSPNYVPGVAGWQISKTGSAQFADVTVTGGGALTFESPDGTPVIEINPAIGAFLVYATA